MGMSATTLYAQIDEMGEQRSDSLMEQQQATYNRLCDGATDSDASDREAALSDDMDKIAPALARLHKAYYGGHRLPSVAEAVAIVADAIDNAYIEYADNTADHFLEQSQ